MRSAVDNGLLYGSPRPVGRKYRAEVGRASQRAIGMGRAHLEGAWTVAYHA